MGSSRNEPIEDFPRSRPATTPEAQENRMISLAVDLAEKQLAEGTASTPVITHYLKLATSRESEEREKLRLENQLLKARTTQIDSETKNSDTLEKAMRAFSIYSGSAEEEPDDY